MLTKNSFSWVSGRSKSSQRFVHQGRADTYEGGVKTKTEAMLAGRGLCCRLVLSPSLEAILAEGAIYAEIRMGPHELLERFPFSTRSLDPLT